jgi:hypothetical protein
VASGPRPEETAARAAVPALRLMSVRYVRWESAVLFCVIRSRHNPLEVQLIAQRFDQFLWIEWLGEPTIDAVGTER